MTLYEQVGGEAAVERAVEGFYRRVLDDPTLAEWFGAIDMKRLKDHQRAFLTVALDGPELYDGRSMRDAHSGLSISHEAYTATMGHLSDELRELGVDDERVAQVGKRLEAMRAVIVTPRL